jgi:hypothetical protein
MPDFGDGSVEKRGLRSGLRHGGTYTVTLVVTDDVGEKSTATNAALMPPAAGEASRRRGPRSPATPTVLQSVFFNASTSTASPGHALTTFVWDFGDGTSDPACRLHPGLAPSRVTLTVTDDIGQKGILVTLSSANPPTPPIPSFEFSRRTGSWGVHLFNVDFQCGPGRRIVPYSWTR